MLFRSGNDLISFIDSSGLQAFELRSKMIREGFSDFSFGINPLVFFINSKFKSSDFTASFILEVKNRSSNTAIIFVLWFVPPILLYSLFKVYIIPF